MPTYEYPRAALTVDCVVFGYAGDGLQVLLIRRGIQPFKGKWALPGGFVRLEETLEQAALRELQEETGLENVFLEQLYTFGALKRDPRERVVSVAYYALVRPTDHRTLAATDADAAEWFSTAELPKLAFDHDVILAAALDRLRTKLRYEPIGFELLPEKFTLTQFQKLYEAILGKELDKRNFRKKLHAFDILVGLDEKHSSGRQRPAQLFRFDAEKYAALKASGFHFEL